MSFINLFSQNNRYDERLIFVVIKVPNMSVCVSEKAGGGGYRKEKEHTRGSACMWVRTSLGVA